MDFYFGILVLEYLLRDTLDAMPDYRNVAESPSCRAEMSQNVHKTAYNQSLQPTQKNVGQRGIVVILE